MNKKIIIVVTIGLLIGLTMFFIVREKQVDTHTQEAVPSDKVVWQEYHDTKYGYTVSYENYLTITSDHSDASAYTDYASWMKVGKNGSDSVSFRDGPEGFGWRSVQAIDTPLTPEEYLSQRKAREEKHDGADMLVVDKETVVSGIPATIFHYETNGHPYSETGKDTNIILKHQGVLFIFSARGGVGDELFVQSIRFDQ